MTNLDQMFQQIEDLEGDLIALEQALVRIPSINTGFMPTGDETPVCKYISDWLSKAGSHHRTEEILLPTSMGLLASLAFYSCHTQMSCPWKMRINGPFLHSVRKYIKVESTAGAPRIAKASFRHN